MFTILIMAVLILVVAILALQNSMMVGLSFLAWGFKANLVLVIILSAFCGFGIASLLWVRTKAKYMWKEHNMKKQLTLAEDNNRLLQDKLERMIKAHPEDVKRTNESTNAEAVKVENPL